LHMRPYPAPRRLDVALVELGGNGIVAHGACSHDLIDDDGGKPPRIRPQSLVAFAASAG
jgi:hypothetical protein